jgi:hypothetical protein
MPRPAVEAWTKDYPKGSALIQAYKEEIARVQAGNYDTALTRGIRICKEFLVCQKLWVCSAGHAGVNKTSTRGARNV